MRAFITGVSGQDGVYLSKLLLGLGYTVHGLGRTTDSGFPDGVHPVVGDVTENKIVDLITNHKPDEIYHLAAFVVGSETKRAESLKTNIIGTLNVLDAGVSCKAKVFNASTSEMFSGINGKPSIYGISKLAAVELAARYRNDGLFVCNGVLFNHESPIRKEEFVTRKICKYVASLKFLIEHDDPSLMERLPLGNLDRKRDWSHAADMVKAMYLSLQQKECADYEMGSGELRSVRDFLDVAFACIGIHNWSPYIRVEESLIRVSEVDSIPCNTMAIKSIGWKPEYDFNQMIREMVDAETILFNEGLK